MHLGLPWWLSVKEPACNAGDAGSIPGSGRSSGEGNGNPLRYSCLGDPIDKGDWWAAYGCPKNVTRFSNQATAIGYLCENKTMSIRKPTHKGRRTA